MLLAALGQPIYGSATLLQALCGLLTCFVGGSVFGVMANTARRQAQELLPQSSKEAVQEGHIVRPMELHVASAEGL